MKRIFRSLAALLIIVISFSAISFAWLASGKYLNFPSSFGGSATPAYFAGGDGSFEKPFRITNAVHLYNLAWLQYLGYFNRREGFNNGLDQTYFELGKDVDMRGRAIPPIGTEEYPFIGEFKGNGHKVTNLTISNKKGTGDLVYSPTNAKFSNNILRFVDDSKAHDIEIVGMFGVTGDYDGYFNKYKAGGHTVDGTIASVSNFYVDKIHVRSNSAKTLAGLAAGYIGGNFSNVGVYRSDIKFAANAQANGVAGNGVLSKYSLVGAYNEDLITWDDANTWGGSIDMRMLARRINYMASSAGKGTAFYTSSNSYVPRNIFYKNAEYNYYGNIFETTKKNNANLFNYMINWKGNANYSLTASLLGWETYGYTYLPLNVDKGAMGLNSTTDSDINGDIYKYESSNNVFQDIGNVRAKYTGKIINQYNPKSADYTTPEKTAGNTGYIVGQSSSSSAFDAGIQVTVSSLNSNNSIYKSFGKTTPGNITYSSDPLCLLTHDKGEDNRDTFAFIKDDYNKNVIDNIANNNSDYTRIIDQTPHYKTIRSQFGPFMGELGYIYGLRFSSYGCKIVGSDGKTLSKVIERDVNLFGKTEKNYKLVTGAINFSVKSAGSITAIVGTYNQKNNIKQSAFNVYKIDDRNNLAVVNDQLQGVEEVKEVYKKTNEDKTITYVTNPSDAQGMDLVYNKEWYNNKDNNESGSQSPLKDYYAYYIEIPLEKGDYLISTDSNTLGYLMYLDIGANGEGSGETGYTMDKVRFINYSGMPSDGNGNVNLSAYKPALITLSGSSTAEEIAVFKRDEDETDGKLKLAYRIINNNANAIKVNETTKNMTREDPDLQPSKDTDT